MTDPVVRCDTCGQPYVMGDQLYSIATRHDDEGRVVSVRHWRCHEPIEVTFDKLRRAVKK